MAARAAELTHQTDEHHGFLSRSNPWLVCATEDFCGLARRFMAHLILSLMVERFTCTTQTLHYIGISVSCRHKWLHAASNIDVYMTSSAFAHV